MASQARYGGACEVRDGSRLAGPQVVGTRPKFSQFLTNSTLRRNGRFVPQPNPFIASTAAYPAAFNVAEHIAARWPDADRKRCDDRRFGQIILAAEEAYEPIHDLSWCLLIDVVTSR
jgi:hypothetical protein